MKYWSKSTLSIYRYLETLVGVIDKTIVKMGNNTNFDFRITNYQSTYNQAGLMIELIERKRKMVNLKVIVEKNLVKLPEFDRKILTLSFIDGLTNLRISQIIGCSLRTLFRRKRKALDIYMNELSKDGFDKNYFIGEYSCERWFVSVFEECVAKENILDDCIDRRMIRKVIGDVTNINIPYRESNTCR